MQAPQILPSRSGWKTVLLKYSRRHANKGKPYAGFDEELTQVREEFSLQLAFLCLRGEREEIEIIGIFDELLCKIDCGGGRVA